MSYGEIVGAIGGSIAILKAGWDAMRWWQNRGRISLELLRLNCFVSPYPEGTGSLHFAYGRPGGTYGVELDGKISFAFSVIEFELLNNYSHPVTVGRIRIDDWIYSEHYTVPMYGPTQDYRVFDLHTRESVSLAPYHKLASGESIGRRIEVVEKTDGPALYRPRSRGYLPDRNEFLLSMASSKGMLSWSLDLPQERESVQEFWENQDNGSTRAIECYHLDLTMLARWSGEELISGGQISSGGEPKP